MVYTACVTGVIQWLSKGRRQVWFNISVLCWTLSTVWMRPLYCLIFYFLLLQHQLWRLGSNPNRCLHNDNHQLAVQPQAIPTRLLYLKTPQKRDNVQHNICISSNWTLTDTFLPRHQKIEAVMKLYVKLSYFEILRLNVMFCILTCNI